MGEDRFLNEKKIEECIKALKEELDIPEDFYVYPFFVYDKACFIGIEGEKTLKIIFRKSRYTKEIEDIKKYKRIYLLIPHGIKILHQGGKTFMDKTKPEDLKGIGSCKLFKEINSTEIYVCHIRSNMSCNELIEFVKEKLKDYKNAEGKIKCAFSKELTFVIADKESKDYEFREITEEVYLIFPDYRENFIKEMLNFLKERKIKSVEVISHGRESVKKRLEAESINVEFYDITSTIKELYQRYRKLEEVYKNREEFLGTLSEIKEFFRKTISTPLILKKLAHKLSGQVANLSITLELYRVGKGSPSEVVNTLEHIRNTLSFAKDELKKIKASSGGAEYSDKIKEIEEKLNSVEEKITFDWGKILEEIISDLRKIVKSIKNLMEEEGENENTVNR
ncbi:MAG TPA: hypothetical protein EYH58_01450 [Aquifex aeolicus]|nr:hypothetical protein [Aquifex aeolicus]